MKKISVLSLLFIFSVSVLSAGSSIVGSMNGWNPADPTYDLTENANGVWVLTKTLTADDYQYKVVEGDDWSASFPGSNQSFTLDAEGDVTWKVNLGATVGVTEDDEYVTHCNPVVAGNFISGLGGNDWDPSDLTGEMTDPDEDDVFTWQGLVPEGNWQFKVTLNHNWDQNTGPNVGFVSDGITETIITYDMATNTTEVSGPPPPTAPITFVVDDSQGQTHSAFYLKGSWDTATGTYDSGWGSGSEHTPFYDDGTHGDTLAADHIFMVTVDLVSDGGANTWEWGVNDENHEWLDGNWEFWVPDSTPQTLTYVVPFGTSQDVTVTFQVYMGGLDSLWYNNGVSVQGSIAPLNWTPGSNLMTDPDEDLIYTVCILFPVGSMPDVEYKFTRCDDNGSWEWESVGNRSFTIDDSGPTQILDMNYWNDIVPVPQNANISVVGQDVNLSWDAIFGATDYEVLRSSDPYSGFTHLANTGGVTSYQDSGAGGKYRAEKYFYQIKAISD